jgi:hypothetical protein
VNVEIVRRCDAGTFVVLPKRWIVERKPSVSTAAVIDLPADCFRLA